MTRHAPRARTAERVTAVKRRRALQAPTVPLISIAPAGIVLVGAALLTHPARATASRPTVTPRSVIVTSRAHKGHSDAALASRHSGSYVDLRCGCCLCAGGVRELRRFRDPRGRHRR